VSQPDLLTQLRAARPVAPAEVREHVRRIAAAADPGRRPRFTWRRALVVAVPVAAALAGAALLAPRGSHHAAVEPQPYQAVTSGGVARVKAAAPSQSAAAAAIPRPSPNRVQRIGASLQLRVPNTQAVSDVTKQAVAIARSLGGYPSRLTVDAEGRSGYANIVLRIPKQHVQQAVTRLSALGTIVGENVTIQDLQAQVDASARKLKRLQSRLAYWQAQPQTEQAQKQVASFTAAITKLRRSRAATIRTASFATLALQLTTRPAPPVVHQGHGPLHGLGTALRWLGIGAVYVLALGGPVVLLLVLCWLAARAVRRRREDALLSRT
jgi:hypothetical protein